MAADRYGQPGQPAPNGRNRLGPGFRLELPIPRGALAIELSQLLLQLGLNSFRQTQRRPAPIPAGGSQIPERPLLAQQAPLAEFVISSSNQRPEADGTRATDQRIPVGVERTKR